MPTPAVSPDLSSAQGAAQLCWESNHRALRHATAGCRGIGGCAPGSGMGLRPRRFDHRVEDGRWWADCSVPLLAGRSLLKPLTDEPVSSCQLAPPHAGLVRAARERIGRCGGAVRSSAGCARCAHDSLLRRLLKRHRPPSLLDRCRTGLAGASGTDLHRFSGTGHPHAVHSHAVDRR